MDPKQLQSQPQPRHPSSSSSSSQHLRPPPHHRPSAQPSTTPRAPPAQITAHPSATISDNANFIGPYPISIGKGTIIHPRTRICATEGPVKIGDGCIISEKSVIGSLPTQPPSSTSTSNPRAGNGGGNAEEHPIVISSNVTIGVQVVVHPGARLHSAVVIDDQAVVGRGADVGAHSKICARCELLDGARVKEWVVVWGVGKGTGVRKRVKVQKKVVSPLELGGREGREQDGVLEGRVIEEARLVAVRREREALSRFIVGVKRK
ncbi:trimeric LpxA-like protein [Aspergillus varians]